MREASELYTFKLAEELMRAHVPKDVLAKCGYNFNVDKPVTFSVDSPIGFLDPHSKAVVYQKGNWEMLLHEYVHYYNIGMSKECLNEMSASLIVAIEHEKWSIRERARRK